MVRTKVYKREHILTAARKLLLKDGFAALTARNIAEEMDISTQPIYLEFKNMEELKRILLEQICNEIEEGYLSTVTTGDKLLDFGLNLMELATKNRSLYQALQIKQPKYNQLVREFSMNYFNRQLVTDTHYQQIPIEQVQKLHDKVLIASLGINTGETIGLIEWGEEEKQYLLKSIVQNFQHS